MMIYRGYDGRFNFVRIYKGNEILIVAYKSSDITINIWNSLDEGQKSRIIEHLGL